MKKNLFTLLLLLITSWVNAQQQIIVSVNNNNSQSIANGGTYTIPNGVQSLQSFDLTANIPNGNKLIVVCTNVGFETGSTGDYTISGQTKTFKFAGDISNEEISIVSQPLAGGTPQQFIKFNFKKGSATGNNGPGANLPILQTDPVYTKFTNPSNYKQTPFGLVDVTDPDQAVHILFDQYGNSLLGTIPQGISNKMYVVHILAPTYSTHASDLTYTVKQKTGSFNGAPVYNNENAFQSIASKLQANQTNNYDTWIDIPFTLGTATDDLTFDIILTTPDPNGAKAVKTILETYTIKMAPVYTGTFDVGIMNSTLKSPNYILVTSPVNTAQKVVKEEDGGNRTIATAMYTPYASIPLMILKLFNRDPKKFAKYGPSYKIWGRNFLDDHEIWARIYPSVGVSVSNKVIENVFLGVNWEIARGFSFFAGGHWGKINTFDYHPTGYEQRSTAVTQEQYDYYKNTKRSVAWAYGIKLDVKILANLFN